MPKIAVHIVRQTIVEHFHYSVADVDDKTFGYITARPLQAKYWAENVLPYSLSEDGWSPIRDGRPMVGYDVKEIEIIADDPAP